MSKYIQLPCSWHEERDADIIAYLKKQKNRTETQRRAIRAQMKAKEFCAERDERCEANDASQ